MRAMLPTFSWPMIFAPSARRRIRASLPHTPHASTRSRRRVGRRSREWQLPDLELVGGHEDRRQRGRRHTRCRLAYKCNGRPSRRYTRRDASCSDQRPGSAILQRLQRAPMSGYEFKKRFASSVGFGWRAYDTQIYRELKALEASGLVAGRADVAERRPCGASFLTDSGYAALQAWLESPLEEPWHKSELNLRIWSMDLIAPERLEELLSSVEQTRREHLDQLTERRAELRDRYGPPEVAMKRRRRAPADSGLRCADGRAETGVYRSRSHRREHPLGRRSDQAQQSEKTESLMVVAHDVVDVCLLSRDGIVRCQLDLRGGDSETLASALQGENVRAICPDPFEPRRIFACSTTEVYRSDDGGLTWQWLLLPAGSRTASSGPWQSTRAGPTSCTSARCQRPSSSVRTAADRFAS